MMDDLVADGAGVSSKWSRSFAVSELFFQSLPGTTMEKWGGIPRGSKGVFAEYVPEGAAPSRPWPRLMTPCRTVIA